MNIREDTWLPERLWMELLQWRAGYRCEECGRDREELKSAAMSGRLTGHHLDENHLNNRLSNGRCLCPSCHQKIHARRPRQKCLPGCDCRRHLPAHNKRDLSLPCKHGHLDWVIYGGSLRCRICVNEKMRDRYRTNEEYRKKQISKRTEHRRARRLGGGE